MRLVFVLDCSDPGKLAPFWSEALGYRVMADPEGNEFCVVTEPPGIRPAS